jgi:hypothetical protein
MSLFSNTLSTSTAMKDIRALFNGFEGLLTAARKGIMVCASWEAKGIWGEGEEGYWGKKRKEKRGKRSTRRVPLTRSLKSSLWFQDG